MTGKAIDKGYNRPTARAREMRNNPTDVEKLLWYQLSARKVAETRFNRQVPVGPFVCDFIARGIKLVIEVDGGQHDWNADADQRRTRFLEAQGYKVIRFWNNDVIERIEGVVREIEKVIANMPSKVTGPPPTPPASGRGD